MSLFVTIIYFSKYVFTFAKMLTLYIPDHEKEYCHIYIIITDKFRKAKKRRYLACEYEVRM